MIDYPVRRTEAFGLPEVYRSSLLEAPVRKVRLWDGSEAWLVTRYADVRAVLVDSRVSADAQRPGFPFLSATQRAVLRGNRAFIRMDAPDHTRLRRTLAKEFTVKAVGGLESMIESIVDVVVAGLVAAPQPVDLVRQLAFPVPSLVIARLLGVPYADHAYFQEASTTLLDWRSPPETATRNRVGLLKYLAELAAKLAENPADDILSRMLAYERMDVVTRDEVVGMAFLLLVAGHETTANMIGLGVLALLRHPEQLAALCAVPARAGAAVDELLRYLTIVHTGQARLALEDIEIGGVRISAGEGIIALLPTANTDPAVFENPGDLDLGRTGSPHLAFGFGPHQCLGQHLARLELRIVLEKILPYLAGMELAVAQEKIEFRHDMLMYGVLELPVRFGP
jgi:cytochrome P450